MYCVCEFGELKIIAAERKLFYGYEMIKTTLISRCIAIIGVNLLFSSFIRNF